MLSFNTIGYLINNHCIKCGMGAFEKLVTGFSEASFLYKKRSRAFFQPDSVFVNLSYVLDFLSGTSDKELRARMTDCRCSVKGGNYVIRNRNSVSAAGDKNKTRVIAL